MFHKSRAVNLTARIMVVAALGAWMTAPKSGKSSFDGFSLVAAASAQEAEVSPTMVRDRPRDVYYPNTENLSEDEMRVIACGT